MRQELYEWVRASKTCMPKEHDCNEMGKHHRHAIRVTFTGSYKRKRIEAAILDKCYENHFVWRTEGSVFYHHESKEGGYFVEFLRRVPPARARKLLHITLVTREVTRRI